MSAASSAGVPGPAARETPAGDLGAAWDILDVLPRSSSPPSMTSTTIEMVAASAAAGAVGKPRATVRDWLLPAATVIAGFVIGLIMGRATVEDPDWMLLDNLPLLRHFDVLREAGSVGFLEDIARRNIPEPRRFQGGRPEDRGPDAARDEQPRTAAYPALDQAIAALRDGPFGSQLDAQEQAARRNEIAEMSAEDRRLLVGNGFEFQRLTPIERRDIMKLARVFAGRDGTGPDRDELLASARLWHQWVATRDPVERNAVIDLDREERLEWLDHYVQVRPGQWRPGQFRGLPPGPEGPEGPRPPGRPPRDRDPRRGPPPHDGPPPFNGPRPGENPGPPR